MSKRNRIVVSSRSDATILHEQGFYFSFFAADGAEPPHIHVRKEDSTGKWWLDPIRLARQRGFSKADISKIERIIRSNHSYLLGRWDDFFSKGG